MEKIATENLFLLEFLVDSVTLDPKCDCDAPQGETCVSFQFLDNAPLDVCEADFNPNRNLKQTNEKEQVKSGKSCLFSLSPQQATAATEQFDINVSIMKKTQPGWLPERIEIGQSIISISNLFNELISSVELSDGSSPTAKTLKDSFDISNTSGKVIGKIGIYIRMSCFGKLIVTQFQMNLDDKSVLFKDKEGKSLYRYKKAGKKARDKDGQGFLGGYNAKCPQTPCDQQNMSSKEASGALGNNSNCPFAPCNQFGGPPVAQTPALQTGQMVPQMAGGYGGFGGQTPCKECGIIPNAACMSPAGGFSGGGGGMGTQTMMTPCNECGFVPNPACLPPMDMMMGGYDMQMQPTSPEGNYQEIGASMGGNSLTIRVHKDKKAEQTDGMEDCICGGSEGNAQKGQVFNMRPGVNPNTPFSLRMGQSGDAPGGVGGNNVVVNPPVCTAADGTQFTEFSDPNKEMFILRIGKKSEGVDKKNNLELELQTPKGPPLKPIPKKETVETQYDPIDAGPEDTGSKGKGGKAKGGGKGKGKKK